MKKSGDITSCAICAAPFAAQNPKRKYCSEPCIKESQRRSANRSYWNRPENRNRTAVRVKVQTPENKRRVRRNQRLKATYGITLSDFDKMLAEQGGACLICRKSFSEGVVKGLNAPHVDHCHTTGLVRGILCHECNLGLGAFRDKPDLLMRAVEYLNRTTIGATA